MERAARIVPLLVIALVATAIVLVDIYPFRPATGAGWVLMFFLSLPIILALEFVGERVLGIAYVAKLPRAFRIAYGVVVLGAVLATLTLAQSLLEGHLAKWGS